MEFRQLYYFVTVVKEKSFTRAAANLHISQPSLSTSIRNLERQLGLILLDRHTRQMALTPEGKILYEEAKKLIAHFNHIKHEMSRLQKDGPLELSIGLIESAEFWMPNVLRQFKQQFADVHIRLLEVLSLRDVKESLTNYQIHVAITNQYIDHADIQAIPIYDETLVALLPPNHPMRHKQKVKITDLVNEHFIISKEGFQTRQDILNAFQKEGVQPNIQFEIERFETACSLVENGLGITVVPKNYVKYAKRHTYHIKHIDPATITRTVYLAYVKNRFLPPIVQQYMTIVRNFFKN
ncbi:MAG TPA: LysR family transcriptional regulator [Bacillota bacterium]|nr:LysR family transcriptional regulator [Bacillota bacterium]